ncbi:MAG: hypothetical protein ACRDIC_17970 [bacterium]
MLGKLLRSISKVLGATNPDLTSRRRHEEEWLANLPESRAKSLATELLADPERFSTASGSVLSVLPSWLSPSAQEFFGAFTSVRARFGDLALGREHIRPSPTEDPLLQIGWYSEHVELCLSPSDGLVYRIAADVPGDESREGSDLTIWHAILRFGLELDYVVSSP